jgi:sugar (pentulose or hexulose) kinase
MFEKDYREAGKRGQNAYKLMLEEAQTVKPGADGLFFIPWVYGERGHLGIDHYARGAFIGLSSNHKKAHMIRAVLEGVTYQFRWMVEALEDIGLNHDALIMIGGGSTNPFWTQIMSDILGRELHIPEKPQEVGSIGVIHTSASAIGIHTNLLSMESLLRFEKMVRPTEGKLRDRYEVNYQEYRRICDDQIAIYRRMYQIERGLSDAEGIE